MKTQYKHPILTIRTAGLVCFWTAVLGAAWVSFQPSFSRRCLKINGATP